MTTTAKVRDLRQVAPGIKGIRAILANNDAKVGWHIWVDGQYIEFCNTSMGTARAKYIHAILIDVTGNGMSFAHLKTIEELRS